MKWFNLVLLILVAVGCARREVTTNKSEGWPVPDYAMLLSDGSSFGIGNGTIRRWNGHSREGTETALPALFKHFGLKDDARLPPENWVRSYEVKKAAPLTIFDHLYEEVYLENRVRLPNGWTKNLYIMLGTLHQDENDTYYFLWLQPKTIRTWQGETALRVAAIVYRRAELLQKRRRAKLMELTAPGYQAIGDGTKQFKEWDKLTNSAPTYTGD